MKKVLIISNNFNALENIGSIRIRGLFRHLPRFGWEPLVLTQGVAGGDSHENVVAVPPAPGQRRDLEAGLSGVVAHRSSGLGAFASKVYKNVCWYPDTYHHWRREGRRVGRQVLLDQEVDAIISSAHSVSSHIIASHLVAEFGIPWVADFRDLWTQNHYNPHFKIRTLFERRLEVATLKSADALVTVSEPLSRKIAQLHPGRPVYTIRNGFDPDQVNHGQPRSETLTITYTGNLYRGRRDPTMLLKTLREMIDDALIPPDRFFLHFYGRIEPWLAETAKDLHMQERVRIHGPVSRAESIERQRDSEILLLLTWDNPDENGVYTGKLFDYLAARRPVLSIGLNQGGVVKELLDETGAGFHAPDGSALRSVLSSVFREFEETGAVRYRGEDAKVMRYSQTEMAGRFACVLDTVGTPQ
jgi:glycosyltransferase involved in cell wall biosynthesis